MTYRLVDLAEMVGADVVGDPDRPIEGVTTLEAAGEKDLSFLTNPRYRDQARSSRAGAILVSRDVSADTLAGLRADLVVCDDAYRTLAQLMTTLFPATKVEPGVDVTARVDPTAQVAPDARIEPFAVVGAGTTVESAARVGAHSVVGRGCRIGAGTVLGPHVVVYDRCRIGERVFVHSGVVIGADGFGFAEGDGASSQVKLPQVGVVVIEDDVEIGANSAIDRATFDVTRIGRGTKIDNLVQIGHNAQIGEGCILCGQAGVSGSSRIGDRVLLAGQAGVAGHFDIGDGVQVAAKSAVFQEVPPGQQVAGIPAAPIAAWRRRNALQSRLPAMRAALRDLERRVQALEAAGGEALAGSAAAEDPETDGG